MSMNVSAPFVKSGGTTRLRYPNADHPRPFFLLTLLYICLDLVLSLHIVVDLFNDGYTNLNVSVTVEVCQNVCLPKAYMRRTLLYSSFNCSMICV